MTLALNHDVHILIYSAPVNGRLFHVSRLIAPLGKLANGEVHGEVEFGAAECRLDYFRFIILWPASQSEKN